jgi:hypothetical protein
VIGKNMNHYSINELEYIVKALKKVTIPAGWPQHNFDKAVRILYNLLNNIVGDEPLEI